MTFRDTYLMLSERLGERKRRWISLSVLTVAAMLITLIGYSTVKFAISLNAEQTALEMITAAEAVKNTLVDAETGQRGFIITGEPSYLRPYEQAKTILDGQLALLSARIHEQGLNDNHIEDLAHAKIAELAEVIQIRREQGFAAARDYVMLNIGQQLMENVRATTDQVQARESQNIITTTAFTHRLLRIMVYEMATLLACLLALIVVPWEMVPPPPTITLP